VVNISPLLSGATAECAAFLGPAGTRKSFDKTDSKVSIKVLREAGTSALFCLYVFPC
jgi:hypothetical protein